jgi:hypothetical protein
MRTDRHAVDTEERLQSLEMRVAGKGGKMTLRSRLARLERMAGPADDTSDRIQLTAEQRVGILRAILQRLCAEQAAKDGDDPDDYFPDPLPDLEGEEYIAAVKPMLDAYLACRRKGGDPSTGPRRIASPTAPPAM